MENSTGKRGLIAAFAEVINSHLPQRKANTPTHEVATGGSAERALKPTARH